PLEGLVRGNVSRGAANVPRLTALCASPLGRQAFEAAQHRLQRAVADDRVISRAELLEYVERLRVRAMHRNCDARPEEGVAGRARYSVSAAHFVAGGFRTAHLSGAGRARTESHYQQHERCKHSRAHHNLAHSCLLGLVMVCRSETEKTPESSVARE